MTPTFQNTWPRIRSWPGGWRHSRATVRPTSSGWHAESSYWETWRVFPRWSPESPAVAWTSCCPSRWSGPTTSSWAAGETSGPNGQEMLAFNLRVKQLLNQGFIRRVFLRYPAAVMTKIQEMSEGIVVKDAPPTKTTMSGVMAKGKKSVTNGKYARSQNSYNANPI